MGRETEKSNKRRITQEIFHRVFKGKGIDIGCGPDLLTNSFKPQHEIHCEAFDKQHGDANNITKYRQKESYDFVYSSHCLEHVYDPFKSLQEWGQLVKPGGYMVVVIPEEDLYEQGHFPSRYNSDHKWTFTIYKPTSKPHTVNVVDLLKQLDGFEIIRIEKVDTNYDYNLKNRDQTTMGAEANIEFVVRKRHENDNFW
jgi:SAM-dependent methyltransferase